jgi:hypothetical protein
MSCGLQNECLRLMTPDRSGGEVLDVLQTISDAAECILETPRLNATNVTGWRAASGMTVDSAGPIFDR